MARQSAIKRFGVSLPRQAMDFESYSGPMGGDLKQSIRDGEARSIKGEDPSPNDRDMPRYWPPARPGSKSGKRTR
jgi:hypothetical protein